MTSQQQTTCLGLDAAIRYIAEGWQVICLLPQSKIPNRDYSPSGHLSPTSDPKEVANWPDDSNVGIVMGPVSGILTLDLDDVQAMERLAYNFDTPEKTLSSVTSRGLHFVYTLPEDITEPCSFGLCEGVDVKAGGYIVAPPSIHPNGHQYRWNDDHHFGGDFYVEECPDWLAEIVRRRIASRKASVSLSGDVAEVFKGMEQEILWKAEQIRWWGFRRAAGGSCRHNTALAMAARMRNNGCSAIAARSHLTEWATDVSVMKHRPITAKEIDDVVLWAYNQPPNAPERDMATSIHLRRKGIK